MFWNLIDSLVCGLSLHVATILHVRDETVDGERRSRDGILRDNNHSGVICERGCQVWASCLVREYHDNTANCGPASVQLRVQAMSSRT